MNFNDLLHALKESDEALEAEFDLTELSENLMDKIDSIKYVLDKIDLELEGMKRLQETIKERMQKLAKNADSLKNYIVKSMQSAESDAIPGRQWHVKLVRNPPKVVTTRPPTGEDFIQNPEAIRMKIEYAWEKEYLKNHIDDEKISQIAKIETGFRPKFTMRIP